MREILFRGKRKDNGEWVYGFYIENELFDGRLEPSIIPVDEKGAALFDDDGYDIEIKVNPETIGQFTGLCDKNGTRIFEGDIVQGRSEYFGNGSLNCRALVVYAGGQFMLSFGESVEECTAAEDVEALISWSAEVEIIGNVHDNPGLLRGGAEYGK